MGKTTYWEWSVNDKKVKEEYSDETEFWVTVSNRESSTILVYCCANGDHEDHADPGKDSRRYFVGVGDDNICHLNILLPQSEGKHASGTAKIEFVR